MKSFYTLILSLFTLLMTSTQVNANKVVVKGYVKFTNGTVAVNWPVTVTTDSSFAASACKQSHTVYTNANGFYVDTLYCSYNIVKVRIYTKDCNNAGIVHDPQVSPNNVVESNFIICAPTVARCEAGFTFKREPNSLKVLYNSANAHPTSSTDKIIKRRWKFGDGDTLGGNVIEPAHTYTQRGTYQICLTIWTAAGCENTVCKTISIVDSTKPPVTGCEAGFEFKRAENSLIVQFSSARSHGTNNTDKIIRRRWKFSDGDTIGGNVVDPAHTFKQRGTYQVCLTIWTAAGCENTFCKTIAIVDSTHPPVPPTVRCTSKFVFEILPTTTVAGVTVRFNSKTSIVATGDSIRERIWKFGDGTTATTIDPLHTYPTGGVYAVCLIIRSVKGCSDTLCVKIELPKRDTVKCQADFSIATSGKVAKFNSANSQSSPGDILSRRWDFGDNHILEGNIKDPIHEYKEAGTYTVCLTIKTSRGCESKECKKVIINAPTPVPPVVAQCKALFSFETLSPKKIRFNSTKSITADRDSIIERKWDFGDGTRPTVVNEINPAKEYARPGVYTVCLQIRTKSGCENRYCTTVRIAEPTVPSAPNEYIKIVSLHPNPVVTPLRAEVWSHHNNITAELSIYDIYGVKKWSISKVLLQGTNITSIPTGSLLPGPYFFRVTTMYGVKSAGFYKL